MRGFPPAVLVPALLAVLPMPPATGGPGPGPLRGYSYRAWTSANGLPQGVVTDMTLDRRGFLDLATSAGLVRFDGRSFARLGVAELPALRSNFVFSVAADPRGGTWVGTPEGMLFRIRFNRVVDSLRPFPGTESPIERILVRPRGEIWVLSEDRVRRWSERQWSEMALDGQPLRQVHTLHADRAGTVWIGTAWGLYRFVDGRLRDVPLPEWVTAPARQRQSSGVFAMAEDLEGRIWFGTQGDLLVREPGGRLRRVAAPPPMEGPKRVMAFDPRGQLWLAGSWGVVATRVVAEGDDLRLVPVYRHDAELGGTLVSRMLVDSAGVVVLATTGRGLRTYAPLAFARITMADGLPMPSVHHIIGDGPDALWIGTTCSGVSRLDSLGIRTYRQPELGIGRDHCIRSLARDSAGALWLGQRGRISRVARDGTVDVFPFDSSDSYPSAFALLPTRDGVWFGLRPGGLRLLTPAGDIVVPPRSGALSPDAIWSLARDASGALWVGQVGEVTRLTADGARVFGSQDGVPPGPIRVLHADSGGTMWIGSYGGGLARLRDGQIERLTTASGLFDDAISAILPDGSDRLWLLGNAGVYAVRRSRLDSAMSGLVGSLDGVLYGAADGMPEGNGGYPAAWRQPDGRLYFASVNGLAIFDGASTAHATVVPEPRFVAVETPTQALVPGDSVRLAAGTRSATLRFTAASIGAADRLQFRYRVLEEGERWTEVGAERQLALRDLLPGRYTLELGVRDPDGVWSDTATALTLVVPPAWWQTWWARGILLATIAGGAFLLLRLRVRAVEEHNRELRHEMRERQRAELKAQQHLTELAHVSRVATAGELASSLAHELNQPLSAIAGNADAARAMLSRGSASPGELEEVLADIADESRRAAGIIRTLRQFLRRGDAETEPLDLAATVRETLPLLQHVLLRHNAHLEVDDRGAPPICGNRVALQQVVVNLVVNAAEAMERSERPARTVLVRVGRAHRGARLTVADSGPGVEPARRPEIFNALVTSKPGGIGMGLAICRSIVEAHGGSIQLRAAPGGGAAFSVVLPAGEVPS